MFVTLVVFIKQWVRVSEQFIIHGQNSLGQSARSESFIVAIRVRESVSDVPHAAAWNNYPVALPKRATLPTDELLVGSMPVLCMVFSLFLAFNQG